MVHPFWLPLAAFGLPFGAFGLPFGQHSVTGLAAKNGQHSVTGSILSQDSSGTSCQIASKTQVVHPVKTLRKIKTQVVHPVKTLRKRKRNFATILPRFCRERAENPPRTRRMNLKQNCLSHCDVFATASSADKLLVFFGTFWLS